jgi:hypothetical protein
LGFFESALETGFFWGFLAYFYIHGKFREWEVGKERGEELILVMI